MFRTPQPGLERNVALGTLLVSAALGVASIGLTAACGPLIAVGTIGVFGLVVTTLAAGQARRIAAPLRVLTAAAHQIGRDPLSSTLPLVGGPPELAALSMALRSSFRRIDAAGPQSWGPQSQAAPSPAQTQATIARQSRGLSADLLTGVLDRHAFLALTEDAIPYFKRYGRSVATLVVDIDGFETLKDSLGRDGVEHIIRHVADVVSLSVRITDKVARFGASEFVVLLREISEEQAVLLANRIRASVAGIPLRIGNQTITVTIGIGVAVASSQDEDIQALIERADHALCRSRTESARGVSIARGPSAAPLEHAA